MKAPPPRRARSRAARVVARILVCAPFDCLITDAFRPRLQTVVCDLIFEYGKEQCRNRAGWRLKRTRIEVGHYCLEHNACFCLAACAATLLVCCCSSFSEDSWSARKSNDCIY